MKAEGWTRKDR